MTVVFVADEGVADSGFYASYQAIPLSESESHCQWHMGVFFSENYIFFLNDGNQLMNSKIKVNSIKISLS